MTTKPDWACPGSTRVLSSDATRADWLAARRSGIGASEIANILTEWVAVSCDESGRLRAGLTPSSSLTNYVGGEVLNHNLPALTETVWGRGDIAVLRDVHDARGCSHWARA